MNEWTGLKFCDAVREAENKIKWREKRVATPVGPQQSLTTGQVQDASQYPDNKCPMHPYALPSTLKIKFFWRKDLNRTSLSTQLSSSFFFFFFLSSSRVCYPYGTAHILIFVSPCLQLCLVQIMSPCLLLYLIFIYY